MNPSNTSIYTVVIIGNGPSGISLSHLLSGNLPYYKGQNIGSNHSTSTLLHEKCQESSEFSIVEQDLQYLSEGLEGRSQNPVALLFDHLNQPQADIGMHEESLLTWRLCSDKHVDHLVIGQGLPGGSWHSMEGSQLTVSLNNWLDLPGWSFQEWLVEHRKEIKQTSSCCPLATKGVVGEGNMYDRASTEHIAKYYERYVTHQNLEKNFVDNVKIKSIKQKNGIWEVSGYNKVKSKFACKKPFCVYAQNVVLASGLSKPKKLGINGEGLPFVHHKVRKVFQITKSKGKLQNKFKNPVLIVGDGLSAADAVLELVANDVPVIHVLKHDLNDEELVLNKMPTQVYHDYAKVKDMMTKPVLAADGSCLYHAYFKTILTSISKHGECKLKTPDEKTMTIFASAVFILIGSKPDLSFLQNTPPLGIDPSKDVDCRHNPMNINPYTYECRKVKNLFALGPLVGDNFVRFGIGGSLGIASHLFKLMK
ncbi:oxidative stress-induced growth inhibitor 2-like isoform X2 [Xenia sp. Carnegie-2017]|nr:oxidative stress-induced growth inhibitor 2-like isoform X2 [Xenia sp. Carnegie-2017]